MPQAIELLRKGYDECLDSRDRLVCQEMMAYHSNFAFYIEILCQLVNPKVTMTPGQASHVLHVIRSDWMKRNAPVPATEIYAVLKFINQCNDGSAEKTGE